MLPKRLKFRKRIRLQFRGIRLLSPKKKEIDQIENEDNEMLSDFGPRYSHKAHLMD